MVGLPRVFAGERRGAGGGELTWRGCLDEGGVVSSFCPCPVFRRGCQRSAEMGRSYFVEEAVGQYLSELNGKPKALITGLLIGQSSQQRDYVLLAIRTPPKEEGSENSANYHSDLSNIDEEWITAHASQVSRMLPGGLFVLGVFTIAAPEVAKEIQNTLRKLVFSVEKTIARKRLWKISDDDVSDRVTLHLCSTTKKIFCRTYDVQDPKSTAKPADWKYQNGLATPWASLECTINVNIHIPLPTVLANHDLERNTRVMRQLLFLTGIFLFNIYN